MSSFPTLPITSCRPFHAGWGHETVLVNEQIVFRFPRHADQAQTLMREIGLLAALAPTLPLPIPQYRYVSQPNAYVPFVFGGYPLLPGITLNQCVPDDQAAPWWQPALGAFVSALHRFPVERAAALLSGDVYLSAAAWREAMHTLVQQIDQRVLGLLTTSQQHAIRRFLAHYLAQDDIWRFTPVLIHQDVFAQNIVVDPQRHRVTGILDWSNCSIGDPVSDVLDCLPYYTGTIDSGWHARQQLYQQTMYFPDLLYLLDYGTATQIAAVRQKIDAQWPPDAGDEGEHSW